ncbi:RING-H2 finger protein ATL16-like [Miscanthus floridulus]|uniref:RING-H2 finger protein ATL16-like n=1 Tax=Miscanthus floridulus TaxID=154761 RepID=UPI00345B293D
MDAAGAPIPPPDASSPSPYGGQGTAAFPIAIVIAIGFMVTSLILITYYFLVVRCWLRGGGPAGGSGLLLHRARRDDRHLVERVSSVFFTDQEAAELPGGLDPDVVAALPVVKYYRRRARDDSASECAVCLGEFAPGERLKQLPTCSHAFHIDCIDTWLHHNVSCPLCRTVVTGGAVIPLARDDHGASCRDLQPLGGDTRRIDAAGRVGYGSSCRFPTKTGAAAQEPITRSFSMDCFAGGLGRKPQTKEPSTAGSSEEAASLDANAGSSSSNNVADRGAGETSGRFRRLLSSFGLGRSSRSTVLPIHLDP